MSSTRILVWLILIVAVIATPRLASGQTRIEGHASVGLVNLLGPAFSAGADLVRPSGATAGVVGIFSAGASDLSALGGVMVRVSDTKAGGSAGTNH